MNYFIAICLLRIIVIWNVGVVTTAILVYHDFVFWAFLAALAFIFRMREHSPYFMVAGYDDGNHILHDINVDTVDQDADSDSDNGKLL